jgi:hypothetical protein
MVLFSILGLSAIEVSIAVLGWLLLVIGICALSVYALTRRGKSWKGGAIAANIIVFILIGLLNAIVGKSTEARIGGWMWMGNGIINLVALALRDKVGLLGLYLERKRLEEAKRIAELNEKLGHDKPAQ